MELRVSSIPNRPRQVVTYGRGVSSASTNERGVGVLRHTDRVRVLVSPGPASRAAIERVSGTSGHLRWGARPVAHPPRRCVRQGGGANLGLVAKVRAGVRWARCLACATHKASPRARQKRSCPDWNATTHHSPRTTHHSQPPAANGHCTSHQPAATLSTSHTSSKPAASACLPRWEPARPSINELSRTIGQHLQHQTITDDSSSPSSSLGHPHARGSADEPFDAEDDSLVSPSHPSCTRLRGKS